MKKFFKKLDSVFNWIADKIVTLIIIVIIVYVLTEFVLPYLEGDYKMKRDYYEQHK